jgi:hypothetical protein
MTRPVEFPSSCGVCGAKMVAVDLEEALKLPDPATAFEGIPAFYACDARGCGRLLCPDHAAHVDAASFCAEHAPAAQTSDDR